LPSDGEQPALGLRERKKVRTRAAIQRHALRLFREQGYDATTVSQIAAAADISESTFFRYFPTKEAVVLWDDLDPLLIQAVRAQPPGSKPIRVLREAIREVFAQLPPAQMAEQRERMALVLSVPQLHTTMLEQFGQAMREVAELVAEREGRRPDDFAVRTLAGAVVGVSMAALFAGAEDPAADLISLLDRAMAQLEAGLTL
jgi:AcrR family transcriptional regulator